VLNGTIGDCKIAGVLGIPIIGIGAKFVLMTVGNGAGVDDVTVADDVVDNIVDGVGDDAGDNFVEPVFFDDFPAEDFSDEFSVFCFLVGRSSELGSPSAPLFFAKCVEHSICPESFLTGF